MSSEQYRQDQYANEGSGGCIKLSGHSVSQNCNRGSSSMRCVIMLLSLTQLQCRESKKRKDQRDDPEARNDLGL